MKQTPILFSTPTVQAILSGRKTQTRRTKNLLTFNTSIEHWEFQRVGILNPASSKPEIHAFFKHLGRVQGIGTAKYPFGEVLWVKETYTVENEELIYKADVPDPDNYKWKSSLFMPKEFARIWLKVECTGIERLNDISAADAWCEGVQPINVTVAPSMKSEVRYRDYRYAEDHPKGRLFHSAKDSFKTLWESLHGDGSWELNPYVWIISFSRIEKPE